MAKGRNKELIKLRDEALLRRYCYWTEEQRLRFDDALKLLSEKEFFISEERILVIVRAQYDKIEGLKNKRVQSKVKVPHIKKTDLQFLLDESE